LNGWKGERDIAMLQANIEYWATAIVLHNFEQISGKCRKFQANLMAGEAITASWAPGLDVTAS